MCLGIPGRVVELVKGYEGQIALVDVQGVARKVNAGMLEQPPSPGDWVLLHMGFIVSIVDEAEAAKAMAGLELMGRSGGDSAREDPFVPDDASAPVRL